MEYIKNLLSNSRKQEIWIKTEDGRNYLETLRPYENIMYFFRDLSKIEKFDYTSADSNMEDAIEHSRKVLTVLAKSEKLDLDKNREEVSDALKIIGCVPYVDADEKFKSDHNIGELLYEESAAFPLSAYTQLIDTKESTFSYGLAKMLDGGVDCSWVGRWLITQQMAENEREKNANGNTKL